ncbi:MAG: beta strand repeat-containing protein [Gemmatimonadota bacterium]
MSNEVSHGGAVTLSPISEGARSHLRATLWRDWLASVRLVAVCAFAALSCDGATSAATGPIELSPPSLTMTTGEQRALVARLEGETVAGAFWSTQNSAVALVSQAGIVSAVGPGTTQVAVSKGGVSAVASVTVNASPVVLVRVQPSIVEVDVGATATLRAEPLNAAGGVVAGRSVSWASSDLARATISAAGVVTGVAGGNLNVTATVDGVSGTALVSVRLVPVARVTISPSASSVMVGQSVQLAATAVSESGALLPGRLAIWSSSDPVTASVSSTGRVTGFRPGAVTISATIEEKTATARVSVTLVPVFGITIAPAQVTVAVGRTSQLSALVVDSAGGPLSGRTVTWSSDQPSVASVRSDGLVTALSTGQARITASSEGRSAQASVNVTPVPVASVVIDPVSASVRVGSTARFAVSSFDAQGNPLQGRVPSWVTGAPTVATVDQQGVVTGVGTGTALIIATVEGVRETATVTVTPVTAAAVTVAPSTASMVQGRTTTLAAIVTDAGGTVIPGRTVTWSSSDPTIATVDPAGLVTGIGVGSVSVSARADGATGTAAVQVSPVPVANVVVQPGSGSLVPGGTLSLAAQLSDSAGNPIPVPGRVVSWSSTAPSVASVDGTGLVTAVAPGSATVIARSEGAFGQAGITVAPPTVASVSVSPASASLSVGTSSLVVATARDAQGQPIPGITFGWTVADASVATVTSAGTVTAVSPGNTIVTATSAGAQGTASISVLPVPVARVSIAPSSASVVAGQSVSLSVVLVDSAGNPLSPVGRNVLWGVSDPSIATVTTSGVVTGVAPGSTTVSVQVGLLIGRASISVTSPPTTAIASVVITPLAGTLHVGALYSRAVSAQAFDNQGTVVPGALITWTTPNSASLVVASTGSASALVTAVGAPAASLRIVATAATAAVGDTITIDSDLVPVASASLAPAADTLAPRDSLRLSVTARDSAGNVIPVAQGGTSSRSVQWSSRDTSIGTVNPGGVVTAVAQGTTSIDLMLDGRVPAAFSLRVASAPAAAVVITPQSAALDAGTSQLFAAALFDGNGNQVANPSVSWSVSNSSKASVSGISNTTARLTALDSGTVTLSAISSGITGTATITIHLAAVDTIQSVPPDPQPSISIKAKAGQTAKEKFVVLSATGRPLGTRAFSVVSRNPSLVVAMPAQLLPLTDSNGEAEFLVFVTSRASKGDVVDVAVSVAGKTTVWRVSVK